MIGADSLPGSRRCSGVPAQRRGSETERYQSVCGPRAPHGDPRAPIRAVGAAWRPTGCSAIRGGHAEARQLQLLPRAERLRARRRLGQPRRASEPHGRPLRPSSAPCRGCWGSAATCSPALIATFWHAGGARSPTGGRRARRARREARWAFRATKPSPALALHAFRSWCRCATACAGK